MTTDPAAALDTTSTEATLPAVAVPLSPAQAIEAWEACKRTLSGLLREESLDVAWLARLEAGVVQARALAARDPDAALYLLMQTAASEVDRYSASHVLLCVVVCELCAQWFEWPAHEIDALARAAVTMNVSMSATQDALAKQSGPLSDLQRMEIEQHAERSAAMLASAGVSDALWLEVVRQHHTTAATEQGDTTPALRLAELLHRVDVYTAKLSKRASRDAVSPAIAARDACLNAQGTPDAIGATLLRVIGLYPPGSCVLLRSGEVGVVVKRGAKAHTPVVALLRRADGGLYSPPARRDTALHKQAVARGVRLAEVKVRLDHERALHCA